MKKILLTAVTILLFAVSAFAGKAPKYVFLFIGDGMGVNQVNYTEMYLQALEGNFGYKHLLMTQFPSVGVATTYCLNSEVTDSAASGTAMASGCKTNVGNMGVDPDNNPLENISEKARRNGAKVAILSSVGVNHATPASFYAHQPKRGYYDQILQDLVAANYEFYAGNGYCYPKPETTTPPTLFSIDSKDKKEVRDNYLKDAGFTIVRSQAEFDATYANAERMVMLPSVPSRITYDFATDEQRAGQMRLKEITKDAIDFLMKDGCKKGFFMMVEGGQIDGGGHGNDAAMDAREIIDMDEAIAVAYEFYLKHPKETVIVVTADHDTGGISITKKKPENFSMLQYQNAGQSGITSELKKLMRSQEEVVSWEQVKELLDKRLGLWSKVGISAEDEAVIRAEYDATIAKRETGHVVDPYAYADNAKIVKVAVAVYDKLCGASWATSDHTAGYVPVYAVGPGTEIFNCLNDNTDMCNKLVKIAKYK